MAKSAHGTLTASTVATVAVDTDFQGLEVVNRSRSGEIYVTIDGTVPTVEGAGTFVVLGSRSFKTPEKSTTVKLISTEALKYSVEGRVV